MRKLGAILDELGISDIEDEITARLRSRLNAETGKEAGRQLGRALCESVDAAMESHGGSLSLEQSIQVGKALAAEAVEALALAAHELEKYTFLQADVVQAKVAKRPDLGAVRAVRNAGTDAVKASLARVAAAAAGKGK
jgi:hypothetical protein